MIDYDIFIDFDRTIYDSDRLYEEIYSICTNHGLSNSILEEAQSECFQQPILYNAISLAKYAAKKKGILSEKLLQEICDIIVYKGNHFVYKDISNTLEFLAELGNTIRLITYGDVSFQKMKINGSGLARYFNEVIVTSKYKWLHESLSKSSKIILIDDNPREILKYSYYYKDAILIEVKRNNTKYYDKISGVADIVVNDMEWDSIKEPLELMISEI